VVPENYATHKHLPSCAGSIGVHFPLHADLVFVAQHRRRIFATLTKRRVKRGVFRSVTERQAAINHFLDDTSRSPSSGTQPPPRPRGYRTWEASVRVDPLGHDSLKHIQILSEASLTQAPENPI
jgi:hypothetical protein